MMNQSKLIEKFTLMIAKDFKAGKSFNQLAKQYAISVKEVEEAIRFWLKRQDKKRR